MTGEPKHQMIRIMSEAAKNEIVWVSVPLDAETAERLRSLSDICHAPETSVAASLLHDILRDDAEAHESAGRPACYLN